MLFSAFFRKGMAVTLGLVCLGCSRADHTLVFRGVNVFDGTRVLADQTVIVRDGKIAAVGSGLTVPAGADVIGGAGKTLLPGLINAHVHTLRPESLSQHLIFGVTTVLDMFADLKVIQEIKRAQAGHRADDRADLFSAGTLITAPGGHGTEYGLRIPTLAGPADAQSFVDARLAEGSDYIKLVYDDGTSFGFPKIPTLSRETLTAAIAATHRRHKLAVVHIASLQGAREAIEAGADGLAHLFVGAEVSPDFGALAASHHAFVIPTLTVLWNLCGDAGARSLATDPKLSRYLTPQNVQTLEVRFPNPVQCGGARQAVAQLKAAHVPILAGDDAPNPGTAPGATLHRELELLVEAGLTPAEALASATSVPARIFHLADRGVIAPAMRADLVLIDGDPTRNILATRDIVGVWKAGVAVDRKGYRDKIYAAKAQDRSADGTPPPPGAENGLISDFEQAAPSARYGAGWIVSTDALRGGASSAQMKIAPGGANGSRSALRIDGEVRGEFPQWAGAMFSPGTAIMMPANLTGKKEISFWAKGNNRSFEVLLFAQRFKGQPVVRMFDGRSEWRQFHLSLKSFGNFDGAGMMGVFIGAGPPPGKFTLYLDDVRIE